MKRDVLSVVRLVLGIVVACIILAMASGMFRVPTSTPAWAALRDGNTTPYSNVIVVAKAGGDFITVHDAINSISNNSPSKRYLIWVAPGVYTETVIMKQYVDIEGAGELSTKIAFNDGDIAVSGASNAELRNLTVENSRPGGSGAQSRYAIYNSGASPSLLHVTAIALGGYSYGVYNTDGSSPIMADMTISATAGSIRAAVGVVNRNNSSPTMKNVVVTASRGPGLGATGISNQNSSPKMWNVTVSANDVAISNSANSSPEIIDVNITLAGGRGISNGDSSPRIVGGSIALTGGGAGVDFSGNSSPRISNLVISSSGGIGLTGVSGYRTTGTIMIQNCTIISSGGGGRGVSLHEANAVIQNSTINVSGGYGFAVYTTADTGHYSVNIDNSTLAADTNTILGHPFYTTHVGASKLEGGPINAPFITCAGVYDENYAFFPNTCP
jgi:hypothetical protein